MASTIEGEVVPEPNATAPAPAAPPPAEPKAKSQTKVRKRAPKACLSCRARKVRCDVSQRGRPCMNCYLDSETCVVTGRASRLRTHQEGVTNVQASYPPYARDQGVHGPSAETIVKARTDGQTVPPVDPVTEDQTQPLEQEDPNTANTQASPEDTHDSCLHDEHSHRPKPTFTSKPTFSSGPTFSTSFTSTDNLTSHAEQQWGSAQGLGMNTDVTYSYYPFLFVSNMANILPQDINYLELQGCLRVPTRAILDEFVQQYFLHFHPLLPLINEGDFWDMYCAGTNPQSPSDTFSTGRMSLLVFQSMLFASCNFVSREAIKALGYPTIRAARAALHRRCKLLYDLDTESSPVAISQAALLLTYWSPPASSTPRKPNTAWLSIAIQHAKTAEAHHYSSLSPVSRAGSSARQALPTAQAKKQNMLKRLWWCCILRDRVMGLGLRRSLQITRNHFNFETNGILGFSDLTDEIERSRVYNADTKRCLAEVLEQLVELCVILTDILILVFPLDDSPGWGRDMKAEEQDKLRECKVSLRRWYKGATLRFPVFGGGAVARVGGSGAKEFHHDSVILYTNLMYMYYHSSRVVLSHHEVLHLAITASAPSFNTIPTRDLAIIGENRHELQDAASGVTECLKELIHLRLARWLPISAVACTALPLVLHILDVKLSSSQRPKQTPPNTQSAAKQHRLNILIEAMKTYQWQYDGVDWVSDTIRHIVNLAQLDPPPPSGAEATAQDADADDAPISDWTDILASQPSSYLRLALTMDLSLSKGRFPEDADFPASLRGLFTGGFNPIRVLLEQKRKEAESHAAAAAAAAAACSAQAFANHPFQSPMVDFDGGILRPSMFTLQPGTVTALSSDSEENSPGAHSPDSGESTSPQHLGGMDITMGGDHPPSQGIAGLAAEVMGAFPLEDTSPSAGSELDAMYLDGSEHDGSADWMDSVWGDLGHSDDRADRETALVLLDALKDNDGGVMVC